MLKQTNVKCLFKKRVDKLKHSMNQITLYGHVWIVNADTCLRAGYCKARKCSSPAHFLNIWREVFHVKVSLKHQRLQRTKTRKRDCPKAAYRLMNKSVVKGYQVLKKARANVWRYTNFWPWKRGKKLCKPVTASDVWDCEWGSHQIKLKQDDFSFTRAHNNCQKNHALTQTIYMQPT